MFRARVVALVLLAGCSSDAPVRGTLAIGGTVSGLTGTGLVLANAGDDFLAVASGNTFRFADLVVPGAAYDVTVAAQPSNPSQTCSVVNGSGIAKADVGDIQVTCATAAFHVGGTVAGLADGSAVAIANAATDQLMVTSNGPFVFPSLVASGSAYDVATTTAGCTVGGDAGTVGAADVATVVVDCSATDYTIGGSVTGLTGAVKLVDVSDGDTITVSANGSYAFDGLVAASAAYDVAVAASPAFPPVSQSCIVTNGSGVASGAVANIDIACATNVFSIAGTIGGIANNAQVTISDPVAGSSSVAADGAFMLPKPVASGGTYAVTATAHWSGGACSLAHAAGVAQGSEVTDVAITCNGR